MKTLTILLILINLAFASTSIYDIKSEGEQIGTLSVQTKTLANNQKEYKTHLKISIDSFLFSYHYVYKENALFDAEGLLRFKVEESDDGEKKSMSAKREGGKLLFSNGKEILLTHIDVTPFDMDDNANYKNNIKKFTLKSFDGLTGDLVDEMYVEEENLKMEGQIYKVFEKKNSFNDEVEKLYISEDGELKKVVGNDFEMLHRN